MNKVRQITFILLIGPDIDEDDLEIFERRCKKSLQDLKFRDLSIF